MLRLGCCDVKSIHGKKFSENSIFDGPTTKTYLTSSSVPIDDDMGNGKT